MIFFQTIRIIIGKILANSIYCPTFDFQMKNTTTHTRFYFSFYFKIERESFVKH